jgi:hypothetical protein
MYVINKNTNTEAKTQNKLSSSTKYGTINGDPEMQPI